MGGELDLAEFTSLAIGLLLFYLILYAFESVSLIKYPFCSPTALSSSPAELGHSCIPTTEKDGPSDEDPCSDRNEHNSFGQALSSLSNGPFLRFIEGTTAQAEIDEWRKSYKLELKNGGAKNQKKFLRL
ncbi:hypothetical protein NE237_018452 [Protea cynaroides]|uniref:Uncharacterized protein n=1 Tax=Protea cynaroides TaxID=273540 RepID=A0A9Q0K9X2_9MAGN|nr:hypothetical protein NE237_018452 [Protea cynaroides]